MDREWFIFYNSFYKAISKLPDENQLELYKAIAQYSFDFAEPTNLTWISVVLWDLIKPQLDANNKRYSDWCKGGRPKKETTGFWEKITTGFENEKPKEKENEKEKDKEKIKEKEKDNHPTDEFDEALNEFIKMRKQIKKPITEKWIELVKEKLNKMYPNEKDLQIKCLYKSIENSWQWVFELKQEDIAWYSPPWRRKLANLDPNKVLSLEELWWYKSES